MTPAGQKINVLLIDDDEEDIALIEDTLLRMNGHAQNFNLSSVTNLAMGLKFLSDEPTDVVLLDLHLPDSKGMDTFSTINRLIPDIPVIILSVIYDDALALEAVRKGAQDYIFKRETNHDLLVRTIHFAVERQRLKRDLAKVNTRLEQLSLLDSITELFNRRGIQEILNREIRRIQGKHLTSLIVYVDLDDFRKVNAVLGHNSGDVVLKEVSSKIRSVLRATDYAARIGNDEFLIFFPETNFSEGIRLAERIRLAISTTLITVSGSRELRVTGSVALIPVGLSDLSDSAGSIDVLIAKAQRLLKKGKLNKNRLVFEEIGADNDLAEVPEQLGDSQKYWVVAQPIFQLEGKETIGYEFLSRSAIKGFESPDDFFRAALEANMLVKVDYQCFRHCMQAAVDFPSQMQCHFNLYPSTMINLPVDTLLALIDQSKQKKNYCIEISEQQIIGDPSYLVESVSALRHAGFSIAIDDLGFGRSCLESLILLEPDIIKIDKKCVTGVGSDETPLKSLKRLIKMAKSLGAEVIAEGIETQQDFDLVKDLGVKYGQGYFLGRPKTVVKPSRTGPRGKK